MKVGMPITLVHTHMLAQVVVATKLLATRRHRAFVGLFIGVDRPNVPFQMFSTSKALATARDDACKWSGPFHTIL